MYMQNCVHLYLTSNDIPENCVRICENGGTVNTNDCSCICASGFTGDNCTGTLI